MHLAEHLMALESELLQDSTRKIAARLGDLLADTFREFGSSGNTYSKADIICALQQEPPLRISLSDVNVTSSQKSTRINQEHLPQPAAPRETAGSSAR